MNYKVNIEGLEGQDIQVAVGFWAGPKLLVNGKQAPKGSQRGEMILRRFDGRKVSASWKPRFMGMDVPQLVVNGKEITVVEPLQWYHWIWGGLPIVLVFGGGALGALAGFIAFSINARVFRMELNGVLQFLVTGVVSVLAVLAYFIAALFIRSLLGG